MEDKIDVFNKKAIALFKILIDNFSYKLEEIKIYHHNGMQWSTKHIYINENANLKIEIEQAPYYTDYGFSFTIYELDSPKYNLLCHVPHEEQDVDGAFLLQAYNNLFSNAETLDLITGKK